MLRVSNGSVSYRIGERITDKYIPYPSPVITVILPVHNALPESLQQSIDSIQNQTFGDFELLIIDNNSTETENPDLIGICRDTRIRLIHNHNNFIDNLNSGIAESKGKYIVRMDANAVMSPNRLQLQYDFMETYPETDVCGSGMEITGNKTRYVKPPVDHKTITASFLLINAIATPTALFRKATVCKAGKDLYKDGYKGAEDYKLWTDLAVQGCRFANIPEILLKYRDFDNPITQSGQKDALVSVPKIQLEYAEEVMEQIVKKDSACQSFLDELITLLNNKTIMPNTFLKAVHCFSGY